MLEPRVLLQLEVEAGPADAAAADRRRHLVHLTPAQFHSLRYQVALRCDQLRRLDASTAAAAAAAPAPS